MEFGGSYARSKRDGNHTVAEEEAAKGLKGRDRAVEGFFIEEKRVFAYAEREWTGFRQQSGAKVRHLLFGSEQQGVISRIGDNKPPGNIQFMNEERQFFLVCHALSS
jgi:hypothetical protein